MVEKVNAIAPSVPAVISKERTVMSNIFSGFLPNPMVSTRLADALLDRL